VELLCYDCSELLNHSSIEGVKDFGLVQVKLTGAGRKHATRQLFLVFSPAGAISMEAGLS
jgi:hypothetical protein